MCFTKITLPTMFKIVIIRYIHTITMSWALSIHVLSDSCFSCITITRPNCSFLALAGWHAAKLNQNYQISEDVRCQGGQDGTINREKAKGGKWLLILNLLDNSLYAWDIDCITAQQHVPEITILALKKNHQSYSCFVCKKVFYVNCHYYI